jgi:hypothetical protein
MYGLGQQKAPFRLPVGQETGLETYTLWARDPGGTPDHAAKGGSSLYGSHPLYMQLSKQVSSGGMRYVHQYAVVKAGWF